MVEEKIQTTVPPFLKETGRSRSAWLILMCIGKARSYMGFISQMVCFGHIEIV